MNELPENSKKIPEDLFLSLAFIPAFVCVLGIWITRANPGGYFSGISCIAMLIYEFCLAAFWCRKIGKSGIETVWISILVAPLILGANIFLFAVLGFAGCVCAAGIGETR